LRRPVAVRDPLGRTTTYQWCNCGTLNNLIDPNGNATTWERDLQARVTRVVRPNGSAKEFTYETTTSRLKKIKDAKDQETQYSYFLDDKLQQVAYVNPQLPTPNVTFAYDTLGRISTMSDGTGTTTYGYNPITPTPSLGAGLLASVDGPLANDTVTYTHEELGRVVGRALNSMTSTWSYDALGRIQSQTSPLGTFGLTYIGITDRLQSVSYPNGEATTYAYFPNTGDKRLQEIHHKKPGGATLARFNYGYDVIGNITAWTQQSEAAAANAYDFGYDGADQLVSAVYRTTDPTPTLLKRYGYTYDPGGNRTAEQIDDAITGASHDNMNRLTSQQPGGALLFKGTTNETATVTVQGKPASTTSSNVFTGRAQVPSGTSTVEVKATDASGNLRTNTYQVSQAGASKSLTYDANGNLTADGTRTFEWDAENRLVAINQGTQRTEITYNGSGERTRILEKTGAAVDSDRWFVPCGPLPCEERDAGGAVVKRFFEYGFQDSVGMSFYYTKDHLGSIRTVTDSAGVLRARYEYDPYGRRTKVAGDIDAHLGFTAHFYHARSGLHLAMHRAYDADLGRWVKPDPAKDAELTEGPNLYLYVQNNPVGFRDLLGLELVTFTVITVIRPPDREAGIKTMHALTIDTDSGSVTKELKFIGSTIVGGKAFQGRGTISASASGGKGCISAQFEGSVRSYFLPIRIDYTFNIRYNANEGKGHLSGRHDGYPSYEVWKNDVKIYDYQQGGLRELFGSGDVTVDKNF
jgi:RHS repeat-associated protein